MSEDNIYLIIIVVVVASLVVAALISNFIAWYGEFKKELSVINTEIQRNTGRERARWERRKRRLLLSILPFVKY